MIPHERSLVEKMQGKPFVLLGVNTDANVNEVKQKSMENGVTWRSWFDGAARAICKQYKIEAFPTLFLIDGKGVIRKKFIGGPPPQVLDAEIEKLLAEADKASS